LEAAIRFYLEEAPRAIIKATIAFSRSYPGISGTSGFTLHNIHGDPPDKFAEVELL